MLKTVPIYDDIHAIILEKQAELKKKYKVKVKISDLMTLYVKHGVGMTEELLGFKSKEKPGIVISIDNQEIKKRNQ